jgi:hypothetical protein
MKRLLIFALALTAIYVGVTLSRRKGASVSGQPEIDQWEGEGGAVSEDGSAGKPAYRSAPA